MKYWDEKQVLQSCILYCLTTSCSSPHYTSHKSLSPPEDHLLDTPLASLFSSYEVPLSILEILSKHCSCPCSPNHAGSQRHVRPTMRTHLGCFRMDSQSRTWSTENLFLPLHKPERGLKNGHWSWWTLDLQNNLGRACLSSLASWETEPDQACDRFGRYHKVYDSNEHFQFHSGVQMTLTCALPYGQKSASHQEIGQGHHLWWCQNMHVQAICVARAEKSNHGLPFHICSWMRLDDILGCKYTGALRSLAVFQNGSYSGWSKNNIVFSAGSKAIQILSKHKRCSLQTDKSRTRIRVPFAACFWIMHADNCKAAICGLFIMSIEVCRCSLAWTTSAWQIWYPGLRNTMLFFDQPEYDPFWKTANDLKAPVYLHPRISSSLIHEQMWKGRPWLDFFGSGATQIAWTCIFWASSQMVSLTDFLMWKLIFGHMGEHM